MTLLKWKHTVGSGAGRESSRWDWAFYCHHCWEVSSHRERWITAEKSISKKEATRLSGDLHLYSTHCWTQVRSCEGRRSLKVTPSGNISAVTPSWMTSFWPKRRKYLCIFHSNLKHKSPNWFQMNTVDMETAKPDFCGWEWAETQEMINTLLELLISKWGFLYLSLHKHTFILIFLQLYCKLCITLQLFKTQNDPFVRKTKLHIKQKWRFGNAEFISGLKTVLFLRRDPRENDVSCLQSFWCEDWHNFHVWWWKRKLSLGNSTLSKDRVREKELQP